MSPHAPQRTTPPKGRQAPQSRLGPCGRCWAWRGAGSGGSSTSAQRSPAGEGALRCGAGSCPPPHAAPSPLGPRRQPAFRPHPHLQLPHHKLLGQVVPPGIPEDGRVAQVVLQTPTLGLGRRRVRGCGRELPGVQPGALASQPSQLAGHRHSSRSTLDPSGPASFFFFFNLVFIFWPPSTACGIPCQGLNLHPLQWKCRVLTTGLPGKSPDSSFKRQGQLSWGGPGAAGSSLPALDPGLPEGY